MVQLDMWVMDSWMLHGLMWIEIISNNTIPINVMAVYKWIWSIFSTCLVVNNSSLLFFVKFVCTHLWILTKSLQNHLNVAIPGLFLCQLCSQDFCLGWWLALDPRVNLLGSKGTTLLTFISNHFSVSGISFSAWTEMMFKNVYSSLSISVFIQLSE